MGTSTTPMRRAGSFQHQQQQQQQQQNAALLQTPPASGNSSASSGWRMKRRYSFSTSTTTTSSPQLQRQQYISWLLHTVGIVGVFFVAYHVPFWVHHSELTAIQRAEDVLMQEANATVQLVEGEFGQVDPVVAQASIQSTARLLSAILLGVLAARQGNLLTATTVDALARLTYHIFQPALMLCSVASTLHQPPASSTDAATSAGLLTTSLFLVMPLTSLLHTVTGYITSRMLTAAIQQRSAADARDVWMSVTFANSAPLPLVFASSLFHGRLQQDVTACISFYLLVLSPIFYSIGNNLLQTPQERAASMMMTTTTLDSSDVEDGSKGKRITVTSSSSSSSSLSSRLRPYLTALSGVVGKFLNPPVIGSCLGVLVGTVPVLRQSFLVENSVGAPLYGALETFGQAYLPSTILVLAGSMVATDNGDGSSTSTSTGSDKNTSGSGMNSTTAETSVDPSCMMTSQVAPPSPGGSVSSSAATAGVAGVVSLSSSSRGGAKSSLPDYDDDGKPSSSSSSSSSTYVHPSLSWTAIGCIAAARFILQPLWTRGIVHLFSYSTSSASSYAPLAFLLANETARNRSILLFTTLMQGCMPSAQNSVLLLQLARQTDRATRMTRLLTALYLMAIVPVTLLMSHHLQETQIMQYNTKTTTT